MLLRLVVIAALSIAGSSFAEAPAVRSPMTPEQQAAIEEFKNAIKRECLDPCAGNNQCLMVCRAWLEFEIQCVDYKRSCAEAALARADLERLKNAVHPTPQTSQPAAPSPSNAEQRELADQWARWLKQCLDVCGQDAQCTKLCKNTWAHETRCAAGDRLACDDRDRDLADIERYNAQRRNPATQTTPQNAMMQCLQDTLNLVIESCKKTGCPYPSNQMADIVGEAQKMRCGYSAVQPIQPLNPNLTNCITSWISGVGWSTTCF